MLMIDFFFSSGSSGKVDELMPSDKLVPILMRHGQRKLLASALVSKLVPLDTWLKSCVNGSSEKPALDPKVIHYVKHSCRPPKM